MSENSENKKFSGSAQKFHTGEKMISESMQIAAIQNGDTAFFKDNLRTIKHSLFLKERTLSENQIQNMKYCFVLLLAEIVHVCVENGMDKSEAEQLCETYICRVDKCRKREEISGIYLEMCLEFADQMQKNAKNSVISWHIRKCIEYIHENLNYSLSIKTLAKLVGLNPSYLSRLFKHETGVSIKQYVINERMRHAEDLLKHSDLSYLEISVALGFSSQSAFIAMFKKITGKTPKHYRQEYQKEQHSS
ncbi:MAG: AraC family transcriptional regulator [Oscillospiraceae bacterium]|nr:AraC family transcriptional regulator [Oscillospiraceae bacterium]MDE5884396.1 AraC family transcriptional regulator [Oscillospiraceae bacterium]